MANTPIPVSKDPKSPAENLTAFIELVEILRRECPWDRKQSNESIGPLLIEESYEVQDAIHKKDWKGLSKELGDILLHVVMHSVMAAEESDKFDINDVIVGIHNKLVSRHPHVFGEEEVSEAGQVLANWEKLKRKEGVKRTLEGVPDALPALLRAERVQMKAARVGFDWEDSEGAWEKLEEEFGELKEAIKKGNEDEIEGEIGDLLFSVVNITRKSGVMAEQALQKTNSKFVRRFTFIEDRLAEKGLKTDDVDLKELDRLWDEAKAKEKD